MKSTTFLIFLLWLSVSCCLLADVKSTNGTINFKTTESGSPDMILTTTGLSIGNTSPSANLHVQGNAIITSSLSIGNSGSGNLNISGTMGYTPELVSDNTTLDLHAVYLANPTAGNIILTLPQANECEGRIIKIKKSAGTYSAKVVSSDMMDRSSTIELPQTANQAAYLEVCSNGTQWYILDSTNALIASADNLMNFWSLNEISGSTIHDFGGSGNHGTLVGSWIESDFNTPGAVGTAKTFSGTGNYINFDGWNLEDGTGSFSVSVWLKVDPSFTDDEILHFSDPGMIEPFYMRYNGSFTQLIFDVNYPNDNIRYRLTSYTMPTNQFTHYVFVWDAGAPMLYIDSVGMALASIAGAQLSTSKNVKVGDGFLGQIDDLRVYNKALSAGEVRDLFELGTP